MKKKKSRIRVTKNLSTNADSRTNTILKRLRDLSLKKYIYINPEQLLVFKALQIGAQMHQSGSRTAPTRGPSTGVIWNNSSFLRLYKSVDECTSPIVEHLPRMDNPCMQLRTTLVFRAL